MQNKTNLNVLLNEYPELRETRIMLTPEHSSNLCYDYEGEYTCFPATYDVHTDTISIRKELSPFFLKHVVFHEYGHVVWYSLPNYLKKKWKKLFIKTPVYVSDYSRHDAEENFAEFYTAYVYGTRLYTYSGVEELFDSPQSLFINNLTK